MTTQESRRSRAKLLDRLRDYSGLFVRGSWEVGEGDSWIAVRDPATGEIIGKVVDAANDDALSAATSAAAAFHWWRKVSERERSEILARVAERIDACAMDLATLIVLESGKPLAEAISEAHTAASFFRWYGEEVTRLSGELLPRDDAKHPLVLREPYGPVLAITPWNDPVGIVARKIAPALAAGCTVVLKPAPEAPLSASFLAALIEECGLPKGVLNVFTTSDPSTCVRRLLEEERVRKLSFTGSTKTGRWLAGISGAAGIPVTLELGGNAASIVTEDADIDAAVEGVVSRKFRNAGQGCTCVNRLFVHRSIAARVIDAICRRVADLRLGHGLDADTKMGPVIRRSDKQRLEELVLESCSEGAQVLVKGELPSDERLKKGNFVAPMLLDRITNDMNLCQQEIFGPILPVLTFDDEGKAIRSANSVPHGLGGYLYSRDINRALWRAAELEVGLVGVNEHSPQGPYFPVGGTKASGFGVEGGRAGLEEFLVYKCVAVRVGR